MKKLFFLIGIAFIILLLSVTNHNSISQSVENLAYVIAIGIDNGDTNLLKLTFQIRQNIKTPTMHIQDEHICRHIFF